MLKNLRHRIRPLALCLAVLLPAPALAEEPMQRAVHVTRALLQDAHAALIQNGDRSALQSAIKQAFAFDVWERFLLENRADKFNAAQRDEFRALLPGFMAELYVNQFDRGLAQAPTVGEARKVRRDYLVGSTFKRQNGQDLPVDWRLREFSGADMLVIDMMVGGTSFLFLKRDEFQAIIDKSGAEGMLDYMRRNSG